MTTTLFNISSIFTPFFSIKSSLKSLPLEDQNLLESVLHTLRKEFQEVYKLEIRDDSRLVWSFITNSLPATWTKKRIFQELALTHYIHNYTDYPYSFQKLIEIRAYLERQHYEQTGEKRDFGEYVRDMIVPIFRIEAMIKKHPGLDFPIKWPWL